MIGACSAVLVAALLPACDSFTAESENAPTSAAAPRVWHVSGSRLRARLVVVGGVEAFAGWMDTKLGMRCIFQTAEDGMTRCVPAAMREPTPKDGCQGGLFISGAQLGSDNLCEVTWEAGDDFATSWLDAPACSDPCKCEGKRKAVFRKGEVTACGPRAIPVPATDLVAATVEDVDRGSRLVARFLVGDDGSRELVALYDRDRGKECEPLGSQVGNLRADTACAPNDASWMTSTSHADDPSCSSASDVVEVGSCDNPSFAIRYTSCGAEPVAVGEPVDRARVYEGTSAQCRSAADDPADHLYFRANAALGGDVVPILRSERVGSGRAFLRAWSDAAGAAAPARIGSVRGSWEAGAVLRYFEDGDLGACQKALRFDGIFRCVPERVPIASGVFADAGCTIPVASFFESPCRPGSPVTMIAVASGKCSGALHAAVAHDGPLFLSHDGACTAMDAEAGWLYFRPGDAIDPKQLLEVTIEEE